MPDRNAATIVTLWDRERSVYPDMAIENQTTLEDQSRRTTRATGTRSEWLAARLALLELEKDLTRRSDEIARRRQALPWVQIDKDYCFGTAAGRATLADLFVGRSQLLVYHFMFGPDYEAGCPSCSAIADGFDRTAVHLSNHDVTLAVVSRAPFEKLRAYKQRMHWTFPWASSFGSDFNFDFGVGFTQEQQDQNTINYNFRREAPERTGVRPMAQMAAISGAAMTGTDPRTYIRERPGVSAFALDNGTVYHTYSAYARGVDAIWGMYAWLDRAPKGRNEQGIWWRRRDEYAAD